MKKDIRRISSVRNLFIINKLGWAWDGLSYSNLKDWKEERRGSPFYSCFLLGDK